MHAKQLAALGGWIASRSESILKNDILDLPGQTEYWLNSRTRFDRWHSALKIFHADLTNPQPVHDPWPAMEVVLQEVLSSELLTRVWSAILVEHDERHSGTNGEPLGPQGGELTGIARATFVGHVEVRNRALQLLIRADRTHPERVEEINQLRHRIERWTDLWLSMIDPVEHSSRFAFEPSRVNDFHLDAEQCQLDDEVNRISREDEAAFMMTSFTSSLNLDLVRNAANPELNQRLAANIVRSIPADPFERSAGSRDMWVLKMEQSHDTAQHLIDQLVAQISGRAAGKFPS